MQTTANSPKMLVNELLQRYNGVLLTKDAVKAGVSRETLSQLAQKGTLIRESRGVYIAPEEWGDELYSMQRLAPKIIYSHETALYLHQLGDRTPPYRAITVPSGYGVSPSVKRRTRVYYIKPQLWGLGKTTLPSNYGHDVVVYNAERTICDVLRSRRRLDTQTFSDALYHYVALRHKNINLLMAYAEQLHVQKLMQQYLEVLL